MRKLLRAAVWFLSFVLLLGPTAYTQTVKYLHDLSAVVTVAGTDNTLWCQVSGGCASTDALKRITVTQIVNYAYSLVSGDATVAAGGALTLATSGVSAGTYVNTTYDAKGRATSGSNTVASVDGSTNVVSTGTYAVQATDCGKTLLFTSNSAVTVTIPASIAPASGTTCVFGVVQGGTAKVSLNGSTSTPASLISAHTYTGTNGTQGAAVGIILTTVSSTATAYLTGDGA